RRQPLLRRQARAADGNHHGLSRHAARQRAVAPPMGSFVALLRAVNVGGTGKLPMSELKAICEKLGFTSVRTYIASGNVVLASRKSESAIKRDLEKALATYAGKPVGAMVRSAAEMTQIAAGNPFPKLAPNRTMAIFLDEVPPKDTLAGVRGQKDE